MPYISVTDSQIKLAKNIAQHAEEASILAGNEVCKAIMQQCSKTILELLASTSVATP